MKLLIAILNKRDVRHLNDALVEHGFRFTEIGSTGGFLRTGNVTLFIGVEDDEVDTALALIQTHCRAREEAVGLPQAATRLDAATPDEAVTVPVGGAQVFIVHVERVVQV